jgi:hypothetical protein
LMNASLFTNFAFTARSVITSSIIFTTPGLSNNLQLAPTRE